MTHIQIEQFLRSVDKTFPVPLSEKQDLTDFAKKLTEKATICTKTVDGKIVSLAAGYTENTNRNMGYISVVATKPEYCGKGLAASLVREFIDIAQDKGLSAVHLYAVPENTAAIKMYEKLGFEPYIAEGEPRPDDAHLIYYIGGRTMNILLTSVGRRAYMVKYFKEVIDGEVHVCNSDDKTVAFQYADHSVVSPLIYDENYIPFLLDYCKENNIDILISLFDIDLLMLARNKEKFLEVGTRVIVSDPEIVEICNDKWKTYLFLKENGFNVPKTYLSLQKVMLALESGEISYPVIVKPRFGCGSIAMSIAEDEMALLYYFRRNTRAVNNSYLKYESAAEDEKIIYQEFLPGQEYGADIINDLDGNFKNSIIKKKVAMRSGETDIAELLDEPLISRETERLGRLTRHIGNMDCDVFLVDGKPYILEMNARFGGGYPFSQMGVATYRKRSFPGLKEKMFPMIY